MLGIKQHSSEQDWQEAWDNSVREHSRAEIALLRERAETIISANWDEHSVAGYSGGKDSLVLRHMVEHCIDNPMFISCELQNEFPRFMTWLHDTAPRNMVFVQDNNLSLEFLNQHLSYLFPHEKKEKNAFVVTFRKPIESWMMKTGRVKLFTGKRSSDGNTCGKVNDKGCKMTTVVAQGTSHLNPIADWSHGQLLAYIRYYGIELPEIYYYPNGFRFGTHPWTERRRLNMCYRDTFDEIMMLDETILPNAAKKLEIADMYLHGKLNF